jgi:hypothetical protein
MGYCLYRSRKKRCAPEGSHLSRVRTREPQANPRDRLRRGLGAGRRNLLLRSHGNPPKQESKRRARIKFGL